MQVTVVSGRFVNQETGEPIQGRITFMPSRFWVDEYGVSYATLAPDVELDEEGRFEVMVTPTYQREGDFGWHYKVTTPAGRWSVKIEQDGEVYLKDLLKGTLKP